MHKYLPLVLLLLFGGGNLCAQDLQVSGYFGGGLAITPDHVRTATLVNFRTVDQVGALDFLEEFSITQEARTTYKPVSYTKLGLQLAVELSPRLSAYGGARLDRLVLEVETTVRDIAMVSTGRTFVLDNTDACPPPPISGTRRPERVRQIRFGMPFGLRYTIVPERLMIYGEAAVSTPVSTRNGGSRINTFFTPDNCLRQEYVALNNRVYGVSEVQFGAGGGVEFWAMPQLALGLGAEHYLNRPFNKFSDGESFFFTSAHVERVRPWALQLTARYLFSAAVAD